MLTITTSPLNTYTLKHKLPKGSIVFCDFDGTITEHDTLQAVCQTFIPEIAERVLPAIGRGEISLGVGLNRLIQNLPTSAKNDIKDLVCHQPVRKGFDIFINQLNHWNIPFVVLSSGLRFCVEARLKPWRHLIHNVHALKIDHSQTYMRPIEPYNSENGALPKADIMLAYRASNYIAIGDSLSDNSMALAANQVFARSHLLTFMRKQNKAVEAFQDFTDILDLISSEIR